MGSLLLQQVKKRYLVQRLDDQAFLLSPVRKAGEFTQWTTDKLKAHHWVEDSCASAARKPDQLLCLGYSSQDRLVLDDDRHSKSSHPCGNPKELFQGPARLKKSKPD